jgi:monofunctional glycosyltransferase
LFYIGPDIDRWLANQALQRQHISRTTYMVAARISAVIGAVELNLLSLLKPKSRRKTRYRKIPMYKKLPMYILLSCFIILILNITLIASYRWFNPITTMMILQDKLATDKLIYRHWTPIDQISAQLPLAIISSEDQKFPTHNGFDFAAIEQALTESRSHVRGASTISQQLAKNLFLWSGRSYVRKGIEAWFTVWIELLWSKQRIMEVYLNVIEYGPGVYGITQASQQLRHKTPQQLNRTDASLMAAVLPNPKRMSAQSPSEYVISRAYDIRQSMRRLGGVSYLPWH